MEVTYTDKSTVQSVLLPMELIVKREPYVNKIIKTCSTTVCYFFSLIFYLYFSHSASVKKTKL